MQDHLEKLDLRLSRVEQILPTLATKDDVNQLESRQRAFTESVIERMNILFDNVNTRLASVETDTKGIQYSVDRLVQRLEEKHVI